jgi:hypothetical protein
VHKNHRIQNIIISHTVFPPSFLSQTTAFHPTPGQTRYIFSSNTSPILSQTTTFHPTPGQTRYIFSSVTHHTNEDSYLNLHFGCLLLLHIAFIHSFIHPFLPSSRLRETTSSSCFLFSFSFIQVESYPTHIGHRSDLV